ncbi:MAG: dihydroorotate dehydrogenase electron transfer subunit [Erysipelotrichaceae bacterium]|nr:dihydroorotate dehydrogenase electron transfer subunit [Erysipelotrichaceae bacterium]
MKTLQKCKVLSNVPLTHDVYRMILENDTSWIHHPGQFVNVTIEGQYLKRPISICDWDEHSLTLIYKVVGKGTEIMSQKIAGDVMEILTDLGNGFHTETAANEVVLLGGGVGVPPMFGTAKQCLKEGKKVHVILGFASKKDAFYLDEFKQLGVDVSVCTNDGTLGTKGFVTDVMKEKGLTDVFYMACGPLPMLKAIYQTSNAKGLLSFEERMGCGFGACMGCSCKTITGYKRICVEGPVMESEDILWKD